MPKHPHNSGHAHVPMCFNWRTKMENTSNRIHPLMAAAAVSVMLVSLVGVAAITGVLPTSHGSSAPSAAVTAPAADSKIDNKTAEVKSEDKIAADHVVNPDKPAAPVAKPKPHRVAQPAQSSQPNYAQTAPVATAQAPICYDCGRIESVHAIKQEAKPSGVGII